jgi:ABC-type Zn uptake system ZnuABC Zn-binding protein ZnuA
MPIVEQLVKSVQKGIDSLRENDVISILKAYQYLARDVRFSGKLLTELNNTVVATAVENKDQVSVNFIINYLH